MCNCFMLILKCFPLVVCKPGRTIIKQQEKNRNQKIICSIFTFRYIMQSFAVFGKGRDMETMDHSSYYNLSSVCGRVCPDTPQSFMDRRAPNLAWRSQSVTEKISRSPFPWKPLCFLGNQEILSRLGNLLKGHDFL